MIKQFDFAARTSSTTLSCAAPKARRVAVANERSMAGGTAVVWCGVACVSWESSLGACVFGVSVIALAVWPTCGHESNEHSGSLTHFAPILQS